MNSPSESAGGGVPVQHCIDCANGNYTYGKRCYCLCHRPHPSGTPPYTNPRQEP